MNDLRYVRKYSADKHSIIKAPGLGLDDGECPWQLMGNLQIPSLETKNGNAKY